MWGSPGSQILTDLPVAFRQVKNLQAHCQKINRTARGGTCARRTKILIVLKGFHTDPNTYGPRGKSRTPKRGNR